MNKSFEESRFFCTGGKVIMNCYPKLDLSNHPSRNMTLTLIWPWHWSGRDRALMCSLDCFWPWPWRSMLSWVSVLTFDLESHHHLHMTLAIALPVDPLFWWKRIALFLLLIRDIKSVICYALKREVFTFYCVWKLKLSICKKKNYISPLT